MTQEDYKLWTGEEAPFDESDWARIVDVAMDRLASFLCLESFSSCEMDDQTQMLLANFICATLRFQGTPDAQVSSKSVRNFTISFTNATAANAFAQVAENYRDLVDRLSACDDGLDVEKSTHACCL